MAKRAEISKVITGGLDNYQKTSPQASKPTYPLVTHRSAIHHAGPTRRQVERDEDTLALPCYDHFNLHLAERMP
jgi:hypothetical protein